ncbi:MAG TPA: DUF427 domain-containing protein [Caulobacteraceae bacterium]|nr:DUF427 domain-containing protein [Caulobacteraceae bacterium]
MTIDTIKIPGPDHPITVVANPRRVRVRFNGHVIADSADVLTLTEAGYRPVGYFPRQDVTMDYMARTDRVSHCPYKGHASYFTLMMDGHIAENAVWTYEAPYPAMAAIRDRLAFFPNEVETEEYGDAGAASVDAAVLHTDEGDGATQRPPWPASVGEPKAG